MKRIFSILALSSQYVFFHLSYRFSYFSFHFFPFIVVVVGLSPLSVQTSSTLLFFFLSVLFDLSTNFYIIFSFKLWRFYLITIEFPFKLRKMMRVNGSGGEWCLCVFLSFVSIDAAIWGLLFENRCVSKSSQWTWNVFFDFILKKIIMDSIQKKETCIFIQNLPKKKIIIKMECNIHESTAIDS